MINDSSASTTDNSQLWRIAAAWMYESTSLEKKVIWDVNHASSAPVFGEGQLLQKDRLL